MALDAQSIEYALLKAVTTHPKAVTKLTSWGITPEFFTWVQDGKKKSPTAWLYKQALDYHAKSRGNLLTSNVIAALMVSQGLGDDQRSRMLLLWQEIQDTDIDLNDLYMLAEQLRYRRFVSTWAEAQNASHEAMVSKGPAEGAAELQRCAALLKTLAVPEVAQEPIRVDGDGDAWAEEYYKRRDDPDTFWKVGTGLPSLDNAVDGFRPTQIVSVLTPSSGGKSLILMDWAIEARDQGRNVLFVSFEVDSWTCRMRLNAHLADVPYGDIKAAKLTDEQVAQIVAATKRSPDRGAFVIDDNPMDCTIERIEEQIQRLTLDEIAPHVVVIDYMGLCTVRNAPKTAKKHEIQAMVMGQLMRIARQYNVLIYTAAQFNRGAISENRLAKKGGHAFSIGQDGAAGSQEIINGSNYVLGVESDRLNCTMQLHPVKMRDGVMEAFAVDVDPQRYRLTEHVEAETTGQAFTLILAAQERETQLDALSIPDSTPLSGEL